jgi:putative nucleotidyltransferase with HDIG domain
LPAIQSETNRAETALQKVVRQIHDVSTLPQIALRVMEVANDPNSGAADLKETMESDAALSARVLRQVNSSAYALRTPVTNLQQAIAYLGMKQIRNLAMTVSVGKMFEKDDCVGPYRRSQLWRHLVSVGIAARMIAMRMNMANFEDMFLAGLLHDLGIIFEDEHLSGAFAEIVTSPEEKATLAELERRRLGFDHTQLGAAVAEQWGFPDAATAAIRYHHMSSEYRGSQANVVRCVELANVLCSHKGITSVGRNLVKLSRSVVVALSLGKEDFVVLIEDLDGELSANASLFQM